MATPVFVDTSAHYALADTNDPDYAEAVRLLQNVEYLQAALVTSNFVISEIYTLLMKRIGRQVALSYVDGLKTGSTSVIRIAAEDEERAWEILQLYQDQDFSYVDATSFALMERLGIKVFFAFDNHFNTFRTRQGQAFMDLKFMR